MDPRHPVLRDRPEPREHLTTETGQEQGAIPLLVRTPHLPGNPELVELDGRTNTEAQQRMAADQAADHPSDAARLFLPLSSESAEDLKYPNHCIPKAVHQI